MGRRRQESILFSATLGYAVLSVVFRWFVGVLISKVFYISVFDEQSASAAGIKIDTYLSHLFLEAWSFYDVILALGIASVVLAFLRALRSYYVQILVVEDSAQLRVALFDAMLDFERNHSGLHDSMIQKLETVEAYRLTHENERLMDLIIFATAVILLLLFSWKAFLVVIVITVVQKVWMAVFDAPVLSRLRSKFQADQARVLARMVDAARVRDIVHVHGQQAAEAEEIEKLEATSAKTNVQIAWRSFLMQFFPQCFNMATMPAVCVMTFEVMRNLEGADRVVEGVSLLLVLFTLQELHRALCEITVIEDAKIQHDVARDAINEFLASSPGATADDPHCEDVGPKSNGEETTAAPIVPVRGRDASSNLVLVSSGGAKAAPFAHACAASPSPSSAVELSQACTRTLRPPPSLSLHGVSFQYSGAASQALQDTWVMFEGGATHGVMGESGGGKSTLLKLLCGILRPSSGKVCVDGAPLGSVLGMYRGRLGVVSQDSLLFARSVRENLCYGLREDDARRGEAHVQSAVRRACLAEVLAQLPLGLETDLTDGEQQLSGGQRQRLHLARLFVRSPDVVLMDEPTSALDSKTTTRVVESLAEFLQGKTAVIVSHHREAVVDKLCSVVHHVEGRQVRLGAGEVGGAPGPATPSSGRLGVRSLLSGVGVGQGSFKIETRSPKAGDTRLAAIGAGSFKLGPTDFSCGPGSFKVEGMSSGGSPLGGATGSFKVERMARRSAGSSQLAADAMVAPGWSAGEEGLTGEDGGRRPGGAEAEAAKAGRFAIGVFSPTR